MATIRASILDRRIDVERKTVSQDSHGQEIETWTKIAAGIAASAWPVSGDERFAASQFIGKVTMEFRVRPGPFRGIRPPTPLDRIVFPPAASPNVAQVFDIRDVREIGRGRGWQIFATAPTDDPSFVEPVSESPMEG